MVTITRANRILEKLGLGEIASIEDERRRAAWEHREPRSVDTRLIKVIMDNFEEVSGRMDGLLTPKEIELLKKIPSEISRLL